MFRRPNASTHLVLVIVSFALTVLSIRAYLELTGYPQIAPGGLHIAHMLWGGIALFIAATLLVLFRGLYLVRTASILTGAGWGFFIDEIGKFITKSNNYFFAPAAVIIYVIFLIVVAIYLIYFRPKKADAHPDDRTAFADLRELLDGVAAGELTYGEQRMIQYRLERLANDDEKIYREIGDVLGRYVAMQPVTLKQRRTERIGQMFARVGSRIVYSRWFLPVFCALLFVDVVTILTVLGSIAYETGGDLDISSYFLDYSVVLFVQLIAQALIFVGLLFWIVRRRRAGRFLMRGALLFTIVILDTISFYYLQFWTASTVIIDVTLLAMLEARYIRERESHSAVSIDKA